VVGILPMAVRVVGVLRFGGVEWISSSQVEAVDADTILLVVQGVERTDSTVAVAVAAAAVIPRLADMADTSIIMVALAINPTVASVERMVAAAAAAGGVVVVADTTMTEAAAVRVS
jgi:hypothetical protein